MLLDAVTCLANVLILTFVTWDLQLGITMLPDPTEGDAIRMVATHFPTPAGTPLIFVIAGVLVTWIFVEGVTPLPTVMMILHDRALSRPVHPRLGQVFLCSPRLLHKTRRWLRYPDLPRLRWTAPGPVGLRPLMPQAAGQPC